MPTPRILALVLGLGFLGIGLSMRLSPQMWDGQRVLASEPLNKVGLVLLSIWLAWPAIESIRRTPGGAMLLIACTAAFGLFLFRPKTILFTGPFLAIGIALAYARQWLSRPPKR